MSSFLCIESAFFTVDGIDLLTDISLSISDGEFWAILGETGSGKSLLAHIVAGEKKITRGAFRSDAMENSHVVDFLQALRDPSHGEYYYQQRYNSFDADQGPTVREYLGIPHDGRNADTIVSFHLGFLLEKKVIQLSSGEMKKVLLARALQRNPELLILDNPLAGLDVGSRSAFLAYVDHLHRVGKRMIFIGEIDELPETVSHVLILDKGRMLFKGPKSAAMKTAAPVKPTIKNDFLSVIPPEHSTIAQDFTEAVRMSDITVRYGDAVVLDRVDFIVRRGERWALTGENGSGKSTLLSLITGDNPQAYANDIRLFDRKRGSGESIWDIKRKIGYISPELQLYSQLRGSCLDVALSGLTDSLGTTVQAGESEQALADSYFKALSIRHLMDQHYGAVSTGELRLVLLVRALIKDPPLLIFDEPCQGLTAAVTDRFNEIVDAMVMQEQKTLIYVSHYEKRMPACITKEKRLKR